MDTEFLVTCPYCGERVEIYVEPDVTGRLIQDCEVCCQPWEITVERTGQGRRITLQRADGSG